MAKRGAKIARKTLGVALVLGLWAAAAAFVGSSLVLPGPGEALTAFVALAAKPGFWLAVGGSALRVAQAFALCLAAGSLTGLLAAVAPGFDDFLSPVLTVVRATPVLALILLAMFWLPTGAVPVFAAFLMAFPVVHTSTKAGILSLDLELVEMARVFKVPPRVRLFSLRLPAARPQLLAGAKNALGLCWKVVVAGEVLAQPRRALGTGLQDQRLSLDTPGVFAWAAATVLLCGLSEYLLGLLPPSRGRAGGEAEP